MDLELVNTAASGGIKLILESHFPPGNAMIRPVLFVIGSTAIVGLSWRSLGDLYAHGFYRFFAFEFLLEPSRQSLSGLDRQHQLARRARLAGGW